MQHPIVGVSPIATKQQQQQQQQRQQHPSWFLFLGLPSSSSSSVSKSYCNQGRRRCRRTWFGRGGGGGGCCSAFLDDNIIFHNEEEGSNERKLPSDPPNNSNINNNNNNNNNNSIDAVTNIGEQQFTTVDPVSRRRRRRAQQQQQDKEDDNKEGGKLSLNLVVLDHYDSFTYNLVDILGQICESPPSVYAADCARSWTEFVTVLERDGMTFLSSSSSSNTQRDDDSFRVVVDGLVLSPGPGHALDSMCELSRSVVQANPHAHILGVCLGHQILGTVYGANCTKAPTPIHGQIQTIQLLEPPPPLSQQQQQQPCPLLSPVLLQQQQPNTTSTTTPTCSVTRYHSLQVTWPVEEKLDIIPTAISQEDNVVMALRHVKHPHYGLQFHPESIGSQPVGYDILKQFCYLCLQHKQQQQQQPQPQYVNHDLDSDNRREEQLENDDTNTREQYSVYIHKVGASELRPEHVMDVLYSNDTYRFWLDGGGARQQQQQQCNNNNNNKISLLGSFRNQRVEYYGPEHANMEQRGLYVYYHQPQQQQTTATIRHDRDGDILTYLQSHHTLTEQVHMVTFDQDNDSNNYTIQIVRDPEVCLPFHFRGGHVGYLGYEVRHITERYLAQQEHQDASLHNNNTTIVYNYTGTNPYIPTAAFGFADQTLVYDHTHEEWYLIGVSTKNSSSSSSKNQIMDWICDTTRLLKHWNTTTTATTNSDKTLRQPQPQQLKEETPQQSLQFRPNRSREVYQNNFWTCLQHIWDGESYELCLTNKLETIVPNPQIMRNPLDLYHILRQQNPAPHAAFFDWNSAASTKHNTTTTTAAVSLCCSSPERFISVTPRYDETKQQHSRSNNNTITNKKMMMKKMFQVEAKPIKGTVARALDDAALDQQRARELQSCVKNRAENLMIVDLLRNDLSRVCQTGTVQVAKLFDIETFATVHQMVSTIRGIYPNNNNNKYHQDSTVPIVMACFPGGSMTGAPKVRTMQLLHELEERIPRGPYSGSLGYISINGAMDLNKIIRTAVVTPATTAAQNRDSSFAREEEEQASSSWHVSIGAGGAITALSNPNDEYQEMILKAKPLMRAVQTWAGATTTTTTIIDPSSSSS